MKSINLIFSVENFGDQVDGFSYTLRTKLIKV